MSTPEGINYVELADDIVADLRGDASFWRSNYVSLLPELPIRLSVKLIDPVPYYGLDLITQLTQRLNASYTAEEDQADSATSLIIATSAEEADVILILSDELKDGEVTLRYELRSQHSQGAFEIGWFYLHPYQ